MEPIAVSLLQHYRYCPRKCALVAVDGIWIDNEHTVRGTRGHRRVDQRFERVERGVLVLRAVPVHSERLGLVGRADAVEITPSGTIRPVEYKMGRRVGDTADVQLCALAMCIEEMARTAVPEGAVWYAATRRRQRVAFTEDLRSRVVESIGAVRALLGSDRLPMPPADERCRHCQFEAVCLPDLVAHPDRVSAYIAKVVDR